LDREGESLTKKHVTRQTVQYEVLSFIFLEQKKKQQHMVHWQCSHRRQHAAACHSNAACCHRKWQ